MDTVKANLTAVWSELSYLREEVASHHHDGHYMEDNHDEVNTVVTNSSVYCWDHFLLNVKELIRV